jgi:hypothetical protein
VGLVKMSARLSLLEMKRMTRVLEVTLSRTKWKSISMCLVRAWNAGLVDKYVVPILLHQSVGGCGRNIPRSQGRDWSQMSSVAVMARVQYSYSVLEWAIVRCLREDQEIRLGPRKTQKPLVNFLSLGQLAQSASE